MSPTLDPQLAQASGYHSTQDAQRMQALVRAMLESRRPIALSSPDPDILAHYSRLLVRDLRQQDNVRIVAHLPGSHDKLVQQVNELLADIPVAESLRRQAAADRPIHVFVVHDSPTLASAEFALLVRLVNDLPGANLRIALVQDRDMAVSDCLGTLGPQALHWHIQPPGAPEPAAGVVSAKVLKQALKEALQEAPESLPGWAQPAPARTGRWRWAFWRRGAKRQAQATASDQGADAVGARAPSWAARAANSQAQAARKTAHLARPAAKELARKPAAAAARTVAKANAKPGASRPAKKPAAQGVQPAQRRNRVMLASGMLLSGALAATLGAWLSMHQPAPRSAQPAGPVLTATKAFDSLNR